MPPHRLIAIALLTAVAFAVCFTASPPASAHQYLVNGSFENGTEGWSILSDGSTFDTAPDGVSSTAGAERARILLGQPNFRVNQSISDVPPGTYHVTMSVRVESTSAVVRLAILTDPAWAEPFSPASFTATPGTWQHVDTDIVIPGASWVSIRLFGSGTVGDRIYIDNVTFDGAAPATMTPTYTHTPLPPTATPVAPTATKTGKPTTTATDVPTSTPPAVPMGTLPSEAVSNGGFEEVSDGLPAAWNKYGGTLSSAESPTRTGARSAKLESTTDSTKWLFQTVTVTSGASYGFEAWVWHDDSNVASVFLRVSWYSSSDGSGEAIGTSDSSSRLDTPMAGWRYLTTLGATAPPDARTAKLRIMMQPQSAATSAIYADDAAFATADPATPASPQLAPEDGQPASSASRSTSGLMPPTQHRLDAFLQSDTNGSRVVINEILYDSLDSSDAGGEWIELFNAGREPVDLTGWLIADSKSADELPAVTIEPHAYLLIVASDRRRSDVNEARIESVRISGNIGNSLNNDGDTVLLVDPAGRFIDAVSWGDDATALNPPVGDVPAGHSIERRLPGVDTGVANDFVDNERPSPGMPYTAIPVPGHPPVRENNVQILSQEDDAPLGWLAWAVAAASIGTLAAVASWRAIPALTERLRHE